MSSVEAQLSDMWRGVYRRFEPQNAARIANTNTINYVIDGGGSAIAAGIKGYLVVDFACRITGVDLLSDQAAGSAVVDILQSNFLTFPVFTSMTALARPTLVTAQKYQDSVLTGWTLQISPGDILEFQVVSASVVTLLLVALRVRRGG